MKTIKIKTVTKGKQIELDNPIGKVSNLAPGIKKIPNPPPPPKGHFHNILRNWKLKNNIANK
jgi:hypothetical protein